MAHSAFRAIVLAGSLFSWDFLFPGCVLFPAALLTASAVGVEYTISNVAYKVFPEKLDHVRTGVEAAVSRMALKVHERWAKSEDGFLMRVPRESTAWTFSSNR